MPDNPFAVAASTHRPRGRWVLRPGDRAFETVVDVQVQFAMFGVASTMLFGAPQEPDEMVLDSQQFDLDVYSPLKGIFRATLSGTPILGTCLIFRDAAPDPADEGATGFEMTGMQAVTSGFVLSAFAHFYETNLEGIEAKFGRSAETWPPPVLNFARYVRNAAYHGNRVALRGKNPPSQSWHHLEITKAHDKQPILGVGRFEAGDLLLLLKEFSDELDRLSVPLPS